MEQLGETERVVDYGRFWQESPDYARHNPGSRHRRRRILSMLRGVPFSSVLDVGCGGGELLNLIREEFPHATSLSGADLAAEAVALGRRRFPSMTFHVLDIERQALRSSYDLILCSEVIEHLADRRSALRNMASMLSPRGHLLLTCPTGKVYDTDRYFGHSVHPTEAEIHSLARSAGLVPLKVSRWGWPMLRLFKEMVNLRPGFALRNFASGSYSLPARVLAEIVYLVNFLNLPSARAGCQLFVLFARTS